MRPILPRRLAYRSQFHAVIRKAGAPTLVMRAFLADLAEAQAKRRTGRKVAQPTQQSSRP
jgi:hypothetical protein